MSATATLIAVTQELIVDWPELDNGRDQRFTPRKAEVRKYLRSDLSTDIYVSVTGPAILKDGSEGRSTRYRSFQLVGSGTSYSPAAPAWMIQSLRKAGATW